jgi:hypothetical protein
MPATLKEKNKSQVQNKEIKGWQSCQRPNQTFP